MTHDCEISKVNAGTERIPRLQAFQVKGLNANVEVQLLSYRTTMCQVINDRAGLNNQ